MITSRNHLLEQLTVNWNSENLWVSYQMNLILTSSVITLSGFHCILFDHNNQIVAFWLYYAASTLSRNEPFVRFKEEYLLNVCLVYLPLSWYHIFKCPLSRGDLFHFISIEGSLNYWKDWYKKQKIRKFSHLLTSYYNFWAIFSIA
jgi:hypothetical protein